MFCSWSLHNQELLTFLHLTTRLSVSSQVATAERMSSAQRRETTAGIWDIHMRPRSKLGHSEPEQGLFFRSLRWDLMFTTNTNTKHIKSQMPSKIHETSSVVRLFVLHHRNLLKKQSRKGIKKREGEREIER